MRKILGSVILSLCALISLDCARRDSNSAVRARFSLALPADTLRGNVIADSTYLVSVHPGVPMRVVRFVEKDDTLINPLDRYSYQLGIGLETDSTAQQYFSKCVLALLGMSGEDIQFVDANYDGYTDIQVIEGMSVSGQNTAYTFYLFDPASNRFKYDSVFTARFGSSTFFSPEDKEITTGGVTGCVGRCWEFETYRLVNNEFILVKRDIAERDDRTGKIISTTEILKGGKLVLVESDTTD